MLVIWYKFYLYMNCMQLANVALGGKISQAICEEKSCVKTKRPLKRHLPK